MPLLLALIIPLIFGMAINRLYQIPRRLRRGELRLPGRQRAALHVATIAAYLVLLGYTVALAAALVHALLVADNHLSAYWELALYMAAYPLVYMGAAWVFYYGFKPPKA
ncbi:MAG: hypothetical protein QM740_09580 [Acidovorax sp.]